MTGAVSFTHHAPRHCGCGPTAGGTAGGAARRSASGCAKASYTRSSDAGVGDGKRGERPKKGTTGPKFEPNDFGGTEYIRVIFSAV